jgi:hypothetical protein
MATVLVDNSIMVDKELSEFYEGLYGRPLVDPRDEEDVKNILSCIRAQHGFLDSDDENQLQKTTTTFQKKMNMMASRSRKILAQFTKT